MKKKLFLKKKSLFVLPAFIILSFLLGSCVGMKKMVQADYGSKHSETEYGWGVTGLLGTELPIANTAVYGLASYHRYSFTGGHDNLLQLGVQGRKGLGANNNWWMAGEVAYVRDKSIFDGHSENGDAKANGYSAGVLAGHKLPLPFLDASVFTGVSFIHFDDFKAGGDVSFSGGNSVQLRVGVEVGIPFF